MIPKQWLSWYDAYFSSKFWHPPHYRLLGRTVLQLCTFLHCIFKTASRAVSMEKFIYVNILVLVLGDRCSWSGKGAGNAVESCLMVDEIFCRLTGICSLLESDSIDLYMAFNYQWATSLYHPNDVFRPQSPQWESIGAVQSRRAVDFRIWYPAKIGGKYLEADFDVRGNILIEHGSFAKNRITAYDIGSHSNIFSSSC